MDALALQQVLDFLPEMTFIVSPTGEIAALNKAARDQLGLAVGGDGRNLLDLVELTEEAAAYLRRCSQIREPLLGSLTFKTPRNGRVACRCDGAAVTFSSPPTVIVRARIKAEASKQFDMLNARIDTLVADVTRRLKLEQALRQMAAELETKVNARTRDLSDTLASLRQEVERREKAEETLRQAQKMEAIGQLTGGIAHDFNNMLAAIGGSIELLRENLADVPKALESPGIERLISTALRGTSRGTLLTQRLLAFARRQPLSPAAVSLNNLVSDMSDMLRRTLGENIQIETVLAGGLWEAFVDPHEFESVLINLAANARDAMTLRGRLTIETANCQLDEVYAESQGDITAGEYVGLFVSDTGSGMSEETRSKAFEPFFTTKPVGHGTGLGLSQVYGVVKQSGGHLRIYSEMDLGTTVKVYLPRHHGTRVSGPSGTHAPADVPRAKQSETVLVVEDDPDVRGITVAILGNLGYDVVSAADAEQALTALEANRTIVLLFTDVVLSGGMNGRELADQALHRRPDLKVLFTTGYARNAIVQDGRLNVGVDVIFKPFSRADLAKRLERALSHETAAREP